MVLSGGTYRVVETNPENKPSTGSGPGCREDTSTVPGEAALDASE